MRFIFTNRTSYYFDKRPKDTTTKVPMMAMDIEAEMYRVQTNTENK